jgi:hypothetical protein
MDIIYRLVLLYIERYFIDYINAGKWRNTSPITCEKKLHHKIATISVMEMNKI